MWQLQYPLANLPIHLVLLSDATIAWVKVAPVGRIYDQPPSGGVAAVFDEEWFVFEKSTGENEQYEYNTRYAYKELPLMLTWLQQQNLEQPEVTGVF